MSLWHKAQYLSMLRLFLAPLTVIYLSSWTYRTEWMLCIVVLAGVTDFLDGYFARRNNTDSYFGSILDFTADKLFIVSALVVMSFANVMPIWITLVILHRELLVMGIRIYATNYNVKIKAGPWGKWKTVFLFVGISLILFDLPLAIPCLSIAVCLAVISFIEYFIKFRAVVLSQIS